MNVTIAAAAEDDIAEGFHFYEQQAQGLGNYFRQSVLNDIGRLETLGGIHEVVSGRHRMMCRPFPYAIYYKCSGHEVLVLAVIDCRRDPDWIRRRLEV